MHSNVVTDHSLLSACDRRLHWLETKLALLAGILLFFLVVISFINIVSRSAFNQPLNAYFDLLAQSVPLLSFLGMSYCHRYGGHIRMDILLAKLSVRALWVCELATTVCILLVTLSLCYGSYLHTQRAFVIGDSTEDLGLVLWPIKASVVVMFAVLIARLLVHMVAYTRLVFSPTATPVAVPTIESVQQKAQHEAQSIQ